MGLFRPSRTGHAGRWFEWKIRIFLLGAALGLVGIYLDDRRVGFAALVVLTVGVILRVLPEPDVPDSGDEDDGHGGAHAAGGRGDEDDGGDGRPGEGGVRGASSSDA